MVFPKIRSSSEIDDGGGGAGAGRSNHDNPVSDDNTLFEPGSPEEMIALSPIVHFSKLVHQRCPSWSQKKGCAVVLANIEKTISDLEQRLMEGIVLDDNEQAMYDTVSVNELKEKHKVVKDAMHEQVENGNITAEEQRKLLEQVADRLASINTELIGAKSDKKVKKVEKLNTMKTKLEERQAMLKNISPKPPEPLKHWKAIEKLRKELVPLIKLEDDTRGRLLSVKETKTLARKEEILEEISQLEHASRNWFEDDPSFDLRVKLSKSNAAKQQQSTNKNKNKTNTKKISGNANPWISTSSAVRSKPKPSSSKKKSSTSGGGIFAAMMDDSDSD